jgi:hypothetical protein
MPKSSLWLLMECFDCCILVYAYVARDITAVGNAFWGWGGRHALLPYKTVVCSRYYGVTATHNVNTNWGGTRRFSFFFGKTPVVVLS